MPCSLKRAWPCLFLLALGVGSVGIVQSAAAIGLQINAPAIEIVSPASGGTLTTDDVALRFRVENFEVNCAQSGRPEEAGVGHIHVMLDGLLVDLGCGDTFTISGYGLALGKHRLVALLAANQHHNLVESNEVEIDYRPSAPRSLPGGTELGTPGAQLVSPNDGATVPAKFQVIVNSVNFVPVGALSAKPNVAGYGQWLVRVDGKDVSYGTSNTIDIDLNAWGPGNHKIGVLPVQNNHHGLAGVSPLKFRVNVEDLATPIA